MNSSYRRSPERSPSSACVTDAGDLGNTATLLWSGGDERIVPDPTTGRNGYGCAPTPDEQLAGLGSSTASVISRPAFLAADRLRERIAAAVAAGVGLSAARAESDRIRRELVSLLSVADLVGDDVVLAASGTDAHLIAAQLIGARAFETMLIVTVEPAETGSGVASALGGRYYGTRTPSGAAVARNGAIPGASRAEVVEIPIRGPDGRPLSAECIGSRMTELALRAVACGRSVLLVVTDVSKTGMVVPRPDFLNDLNAVPGIDVLVDACQMRLGFDDLRAYLERGWMVAVTGSKFIGGPSFSGALLIPRRLGTRLRQKPPSSALRGFSSAYDWPGSWLSLEQLGSEPNWGLILRWEAALHELRAFRCLPGEVVRSVLREFEFRIERRLAADPMFERLPTPLIARDRLTGPDTWSGVATIVPLLLFRDDSRTGRRPLDRSETVRVWELLQSDLYDGSHQIPPMVNSELGRMRFHLGRPAACGTRNGVPVAALRLCIGARLIAEAAEIGEPVFARVIAALDKAALIVGQDRAIDTGMLVVAQS